MPQKPTELIRVSQKTKIFLDNLRSQQNLSSYDKAINLIIKKSQQYHLKLKEMGYED